MKDRLKYVIDSRYFDGTCLTSMSDGFSNDYGGETIEELRIRENNPYLKAITPSELDKMLRIYNQSLSEPFKEITEEEYYDLLDVLPPIRMRRNSFFVGEPYYGNMYSFCFTSEGRYFKGLRSVLTPQSELERQISRHMEIINRRPVILKDGPVLPIEDNPDKIMLTSYYFLFDGKKKLFICNHITEQDNKRGRNETAGILKSLRRNHYQFYKGKGHYDTPDELIDHVSGKKLTLVSDGHFFQYPPGRESATFIGHVKETSEEFLFRIYDREYFLYLLKRLRTVKKESAQEQINIKS